MDEEALRARLERHGQAHLLRFFAELTAAPRQRLLAQIAAIDFEALQLGTRRAVRAPHADDVPPPPPPNIGPYTEVIERDEAADRVAIERGEAALRAGRVGVLLVAGGQGTRLGFEGPKGAFRLGAVSGRTLLQIHIDSLLAAGRRYGVLPLLCLMTSPANHDATLALLAAHGNFGLPSDRLTVFAQGVAPAVDEDGRLLLAAKDALVLSPNGNGGVFVALRDCGALAAMERAGIDTISYVQIDNPLARAADPFFIGHHLARQSDYSCKAIAKLGPLEKVGNFARVDGRLSIVEYTDIPPALAEQRDARGQLAFGYGSPGLFLWSRDFAVRQAERRDLPIHWAHKRVPYIDERGELVQPASPNAYKIETFALDTLPSAERALVLACDRAAEFAPVKNAEGSDSPESARRQMTQLYSGWIEAAGGSVAPGVQVEISPQVALDAEELRIRLPPRFRVDRDLFLGQSPYQVSPYQVS